MFIYYIKFCMRKRNYTIDIVATVIYIVRVFQKKRKLLPFMYITS